MKRHVNDPYVEKARKDGYRCRSAYKLIQINNKLSQEGNAFLFPGLTVMDCGCAPGSWSQVTAELINADGLYNAKAFPGLLVGCDLLDVEPVTGARLLSGYDFTTKETKSKMETMLEGRPLDIVLSDMAPNASGVKGYDQERSILLAKQVFEFAQVNGVRGTSVVCKIFGNQGNFFEKLISDLETAYKTVFLYKPKASRNDSFETYIIALRQKDKGDFAQNNA